MPKDLRITHFSYADTKLPGRSFPTGKLGGLVDLRRFELLTSALRTQRSPS